MIHTITLNGNFIFLPNDIGMRIILRSAMQTGKVHVRCGPRCTSFVGLAKLAGQELSAAKIRLGSRVRFGR